MPHDIRLILTDIDGTILPYGQERISERAARAMHASLDAGIRVGPASGREISYVAPLFGGDEALYATALATNGMQVHLDGEQICEKHVRRDALVELQAWCLANAGEQVGLVVFVGRQPVLCAGTMEGLWASFPKYAEIAEVSDVVPAGPTIKTNMYVVGDLARTQEVVARLNRELPALTFDAPEPSWCNVTPHGWTKASGVDLLCERLGIGLDQVVVFGDGGNDVPMLEHVPHSVAVAGAHANAATAARHHIGPAEDDSVAAAIAALAAGDWPFER